MNFKNDCSHFLVYGSQLGQETSEIEKKEPEDSFASSLLQYRQDQNLNREIQPQILVHTTEEEVEESNDKVMPTQDEQKVEDAGLETEDAGLGEETELGCEPDVGTDRHIEEHVSEQGDISVGIIRGIFGVLYKG